MSGRRHLLVTNDFPPKVGGIQSYLWELWRRLDPSSFQVLTASSHPDARAFDAAQAAQGIRIDRVPGSTLLFATRRNRRAVRAAIEGFDPELVFLDPVFPLGLLAGQLERRCALILHGAEVSIPGRIPLVGSQVRRAFRRSDGILAAGPYPLQAAVELAGTACPPVLEIPPGVDTDRFRPLAESQRVAFRERLGISADALLVSSVSRLVPRKGMDTLIKAASLCHARLEQLQVVIGGTGRDEKRLRRLVASTRAPVRLLGQVSDDELPMLLAASDLFVMDCRSRWGGLEQEGFGIVFLEAAAAGVAQIAGLSGGSADAVVDGETGLVVREPESPRALADAIEALLSDPARRLAMGRAARSRAEASFDYGVLARRLSDALDAGWPSAG